MKLLLHTCCAPCSGAIVEALLKEGHKPVIYFCNPNIYPYEEYLKRAAECRRYASECGIDMVEAEYSHDKWLQCVSGLENEPERGARCTACFRHRLLSAAQYALSHGFDTLATTLASSRWKNLVQVNEAGMWAVDSVNDDIAQIRGGKAACPDAEDAGTRSESGGMPCPDGLTWWGRNWRKGGLQERRNEIIRERGFYNQTWCGCEFSTRKLSNQ